MTTKFRILSQMEDGGSKSLHYLVHSYRGGDMYFLKSCSYSKFTKKVKKETLFVMHGDMLEITIGAFLDTWNGELDFTQQCQHDVLDMIASWRDHNKKVREAKIR